jgi:hypothetical protein
MQENAPRKRVLLWYTRLSLNLNISRAEMYVEIRKRDHLPTKRFFLCHLRSGGKIVKLL